MRVIGAEQTGDAITAPQATGQARAAQAACERDCPLAGLAADTGWHCWVGVAGILYARRPRAAPPMVVRSVSIDGLRKEIERAERERGLRP